MGIRGLTSYITRNADHFHQTLHLHDCVLVIDGCSLACQLFMHASKCNIAFGGDYDEYAQTLMDFFSLLKKCNVTPLVIVDGGYEARKLKTISKRMRRKLYNAKICNPVNMSRAPVFPLLLMEVFKQTLKRIGVQFAQADFEADYEIAAAARYLNCPVLSNDSDFYVFDVDYIPFSTLKRNLVKMIKDGSTKYYLNCEMYSVKYLLARFGGLDKSLLPLMATLLGNDYVPSSIFKKFFDQVKLPKSKKMSLQQRRIVATFEWLRKESLETASSKILNHLRKEHRKYVQKQIEMSVSGYNICQSDLIALFDLQGMHPQVEVPEKDGELLYGESDFPEDTLDEVESDNEDEDSCNEFDSLDPTFEFEANTPGSDVHFPVWLTDKFRRGDLPSYVSDIYHLRLYFCQPQVEDFSTEDSHCTSFQILKVICGLLLSISDKQTLNSVDNSIMCYSRCSGSKHMKCELYLTHSLPCLPQFPPVALLLQLPISLRKLLLYNTLNITNSEEITLLDSFGKNWSLFCLAIVFWARNASPVINSCHIHSLIIGMIALGVVDKKLGRIRHQKEITQRTNNALSKGSTNLDSYKEATNAYPLELFSENIRNTLDNTVLKVSENDCLNVIESLLQFYHMDPKLKHSPGLFYASIVHSFAQFQACLMQVMCLNAILDFPVTQCNVADVYSGTVAYMGFSNFHKRRNVPSYIHTLMVNSPTLYDLYKEIFDRFQILLPNVPVLFRKGKRKSKCKRLKPADTPTDSNSEGWESKQESVSGFDVQNKFWALSVL